MVEITDNESGSEAPNHLSFHQEEDVERCNESGSEAINHLSFHQEEDVVRCNEGGSEALNHESFHQEEDVARCNDLEWDCTDYFVTNKVFKSRDELTKWCKQVGKTCGTIVCIKRSDNKKYGRSSRVTYACERSGIFRDAKKSINKPVRHTGTKKCGCPFSLKGVKLPDEDEWELKVICGRHNHPIQKDPTFEGHAFAGRLSSDEQKFVRDLIICRVKTKEILRLLKQRDPNNASTADTIYNFKSKYRISEMQGRSQMQHLLQILDEQKYVEFHRRNEDTEEVLDIFFAHPYSLQLFKCFPEVLIMDCTYKTNRHNLPLLEICGVTSTGKTFIIAHAYLKQEIAGSYRWALQCLKDINSSSVTPFVIVTDRDLALMSAIDKTFDNVVHLLCKWHISKNVEGRGKRAFTTKKEWDVFFDEFHDLIRCSTEESFDEELHSFVVRYNKEKKHQELVKYITDTWFTSYKVRFVCAWTNSVMHFGNVTTNRVESQHAALKKYLGSSQGDLINNFKMTHNLLLSQHVDVRASFARSLSHNMHDHRIPDFNYLRGFVSRDALDMILEEKKRGEYIGIDVSKCGCVLKRTHGLPCAHEIVQLKREGRGIPLSSIHPRWKQLSDVPRNVSDQSIDCEQELSLIRKRFDSASEEQKCMIKKLLLELGNPTSTNLELPSKNNIGKGRPSTTKKKASKKAKNSTKRDPSLFEFAKTQEEQQIQVPVKCNTTSKRKPEVTCAKNTCNPQSEESSKKTSKKKQKTTLGEQTSKQFLDSILETFDVKIKNIVIERLEDVAPDGHCGYRCCAELLGLSSNDGWKIIRQRMLLELTQHKDLHMGMLGGENHYHEVEIALNYFKTYRCTTMYWMQFPAMGCLFATTFNCVLCVLSPKQYTTYLPLRLAPPAEINFVQMVLYDDNHFVKFYWKDGAPIPPIMPGWHHHRYPEASLWEDIIFERIIEWEKLIGFPTIEVPSIQNLEKELLSAIKTLQSLDKIDF